MKSEQTEVAVGFDLAHAPFPAVRHPDYLPVLDGHRTDAVTALGVLRHPVLPPVPYLHEYRIRVSPVDIDVLVCPGAGVIKGFEVSDGVCEPVRPTAGGFAVRYASIPSEFVSHNIRTAIGDKKDCPYPSPYGYVHRHFRERHYLNDPVTVVVIHGTVVQIKPIKALIAFILYKYRLDVVKGVRRRGRRIRLNVCGKWEGGYAQKQSDDSK